MIHSVVADNDTKAAKARGNHLRVHFKHTREIGQAIKGMKLARAQKYLKEVLEFKSAIPFTKYKGGIGRHAIGKQYKAPGNTCGWPIKATKTFLDLLVNVASNATVSSDFSHFLYIFYSSFSFQDRLCHCSRTLYLHC